MLIAKNTILVLNGQKVMLTNNTCIKEDEQGYFILNFWEPCENKDMDVIPVVFVGCNNKNERYVLKKDNIIMGSEKDICLT